MNYICTSCGYESSKWYGRCPSCSNWNTFEQLNTTDLKRKKRGNVHLVKPTKLNEVVSLNKSRLSTGFEEFDRVLGGGIIQGEVILLSGDPGIGKSTLLLQVALKIATVGASSLRPFESPPLTSVLYITGEESEDQVKIRAERLVSLSSLSKANLFILSTTNIDAVIELLKSTKPTLVIIDSIQTMESDEVPSYPGSIPQIRHVTGRLVEIAKTSHIPIVLVGHVTKEGIVAGPMLLSHMVDCVLYLEGEQMSGTRILRSFKNRFGDISEVGIFTMQEKGLEQIQDASNFFMNKKDKSVAGSCSTVVLEGSRPILVEIQGLAIASNLSFPRRVVTGLSDKRVELLLAVIQKHGKIPIATSDIFVNVVGGFKIEERAADLAVCLAIISSFKNKPLFSTAATAEVGLLGELRNVISVEKRVKEAKKFGFQTILTSTTHTSLIDAIKTVI